MNKSFDTAGKDDKIRWHYLSSEPQGGRVAGKNDKINWDRLSSSGDADFCAKENQLGRALGAASGKAIDLLRHPEKINCPGQHLRLDAGNTPINWNILSFNRKRGRTKICYIYNLLDNNRRVLYSNRRSLNHR
jgi:hypothetical protein